MAYLSCNVHLILILALSALARAAAAQDATPQPGTMPPDARREWTVTWDNRPSVRYGDLVRIDVRARFTGELRDSGVSVRDRDTSHFDIARRRIGVAGAIGRRAEFQIERELGSSRPWRDVYLDYRGFEDVSIQAGQFKLPFGLDENTSSTNIDFVYRSRAATLSPGRDPGVMAHGRAGVLRYEAGVFTRDGDNGRDDRTAVFAGVTPAARLVVQPFRGSTTSMFEDFQAGVAFTTGNTPAGLADVRGPTALGRPFLREEFGIQGTRRRVGVEMRWRPGPLSVQSEYVRLSTERRGQSVENTDLPPLSASAWYVHGTWVLTGEEKARGADEPTRPLFDGGFGSIELAARIEAARFSSAGDGLPGTGPRAETILPHRDRALTLGVNWSLNRWIRLQANLVRDTMSISSSSFWSRAVRLRFAM